MKIFHYSENKELRDIINEYRSGRRDFTPKELNDIKLYISKYKDLVDNTKFFSGTIKEYKVVSCFAESFFEELHSRMLTTMSADISIIVVLSTKEVLFKKNTKTCEIDLCKLSQILCNGECDEMSTDIAAGKMTESFINLTKKFIQCT